MLLGSLSIQTQWNRFSVYDTYKVPLRLSCYVRPDVSLTSAYVRSQVTWRSRRSCGKYNSLKICLILFKFCAPSSSQAPWKQGMSRTPISSIFLSPNFIWRKSLTRSGKWCGIRFYEKTTYRSFTQLHLSNWPIRNYSSVQFLRQTLPGNTLAVGTKSIPSVSSAAKHTGSGLLQPSVTWPLR